MSAEGKTYKLKPELAKWFKDPDYLTHHELGWWCAKGFNTTALLTYYCEMDEKDAFMSIYGCIDNINRSVEHYLIYVQLEAPNHVSYSVWLKAQDINEL